MAGAFALPVTRWLIARGEGHTVVHETGIHGGPSSCVVGAIAAVAFIFSTAVLVADAFKSNVGDRGNDAPHAATMAGHHADTASVSAPGR